MRSEQMNEWMNRSGQQRPVEDVKYKAMRSVQMNEWMNRSGQQRPVGDIR